MAFEINELHHQPEQYPTALPESFQTPGLSLRTLSLSTLSEENAQYAGTGGISQLNHQYGFVPAFQCTDECSTEISRFGNGKPAPFHTLDGLPQAWIAERSPDGKVLSVRSSVIAGFVRQNRFYTREQAARAVKIINLDD